MIENTEFVEVVKEISQDLNIHLTFVEIDESPERNVDLFGKVDGKTIPFDFFAVCHKGEPKSKEQLTDELKGKIDQHLHAMKDPKVLISETGSKFATHHLPDTIKITIDKEGYLLINGRRIVDDNKQVKAGQLRSYTILHCEVEGHLLIIQDEFEQIRPEGPKPFVFDLNEKGSTYTLHRSKSKL